MLQHLDVLDEWVVKHKNTIKEKYERLGKPRMGDEISKEHNKNFAVWFKNLMNENPLLPESNENAHLIYALSQGPAYNLATYQAFDINGYTFYTKEKDKTSSVYQNSGVTMESLTGDEKRRYYGRIEEIS